MNNTQFRRLVLDTPFASHSDGGNKGATPALGGATPALGSRMRSNIPMTPRSVAGNSNSDFRRQLAERDAEINGSTEKKFRSSAAPKGTKLGSGYQDRTQLRTSGEEDDKAVRVRALEDMVKLGQMDQETFEKLRDEIVGGDLKDVHLVKGLDYKLLERVRRGEDVLSDAAKPTQAEPSKEASPPPIPKVDVDEEFEEIEGKEITPVVKVEKAKKGEMAPPPQLAGQKRSRDEILRALKESRAAAAAEKARQPQLGPKFVRIGEKKQESRIERDGRGREVLITSDEHGNIKRKVRKSQADSGNVSNGLLMPEKDAKPLGMEVPLAEPEPLDEDDGDIFEGVGADYNPLGDLVGDDTDSSEDEIHGEPSKDRPPSSKLEPEPPHVPPSARKKSNYFGESETELAPDPFSRNPLNDPSILAALKKAVSLDPLATSAANEEEAAKLARRKKMLEASDRDAEDMDLEFGSSRFGDQEDGEDRRIKLSEWDGDGDEDEGKGERKAKRKRGGKKRKGDANSAADVLGVMERRKAEGR